MRGIRARAAQREGERRRAVDRQLAVRPEQHRLTRVAFHVDRAEPVPVPGVAGIGEVRIGPRRRRTRRRRRRSPCAVGSRTDHCLCRQRRTGNRRGSGSRPEHGRRRWSGRRTRVRRSGSCGQMGAAWQVLEAIGREIGVPSLETGAWSKNHSGARVDTRRWPGFNRRSRFRFACRHAQGPRGPAWTRRRPSAGCA